MEGKGERASESEGRRGHSQSFRRTQVILSETPGSEPSKFSLCADEGKPAKYVQGEVTLCTTATPAGA